jgi:hypothetical protein
LENQVAVQRRFLGLSQAEWWLWVKWVLVTTVVGFFGVAGLTLGVMGGVVYTSVLTVVFGVLVGTAQWRLLRKHVPQAGRWVLATAVGWIVCAIVNLGAGGIMISRQRFGLAGTLHFW